MAGVGTRGTPGGLEGLAALAEVAVTEARRRVSGELPSPAEVREIARVVYKLLAVSAHCF